MISGTAFAAATDFSAGSWIIPMDTCGQVSQSFNGGSFDGNTYKGEMTDVTGEISRSLNPECFRLLPRYIDDLDFARSDDVKFRIAITGMKQGFSGGKFFGRPAGVARETRYLRFGQGWKRNCI